MDTEYYPPESGRWKTYRDYKFILWAWMMNEITVVFSPVQISHEGFYIYSVIQLIAAVLFGIPLVYSEICIAQYTNCNIVSMWNFLPIFRSFGYGTFYLIILKTIYVIVLASWYLEYAFYSAHDPPPWFTCDDFNDSKCMIKVINVSIFQQCIEAQTLFNTDCGMKTGSNCFFLREIGDYNTKSSFCVHLWKVAIARSISGLILFILSIKREQFIQRIVKVLAIYVCFAVFILLWVTLSSNGTWYSTKIILNWADIDFTHSISAFTRGVLTCGAGCGIIIFISRDIPFRSSAIMTSVTVPLCAISISIIFALIIFGGIKTMSYYHGEEESVLEIGDSLFFKEFASTSETLMYFDQLAVWTFLWFSTIFLCLFINLWLLYLFLQESLFTTLKLARKYNNLASALLMAILCILSSPFYCCDLAAVLNDVVDILQLTNLLFFTLAVYWFYGFKSHCVDIIFMIGVKPSLYWKIAWISSPVVMSLVLFFKWKTIFNVIYDDSYFIESLLIRCDKLLLYILVSVYFFVIFIHMLIQLKNYYYRKHLRYLFRPAADWGPKDKTLFRSRTMFVPEIMTREFLYRQIRIRGYSKKKSKFKLKDNDSVIRNGPSSEQVEWNALTSN